MVLDTGLNMQLGALREQPQVQGSCFAKKRNEGPKTHAGSETARTRWWR